MHLAAFRALYFVAACGNSCKFRVYWDFLVHSPHDISQSMRKWKFEFDQDVITDVPTTKKLKALLHMLPMQPWCDSMIFIMNVNDQNKKVVTETVVEQATRRYIGINLNQLDHIANWAQELPTLTIIRYIAPFFSRTRPKSGPVSRSSRAQYVVFDLATSCIRPSDLARELFSGRRSRVCGWRFCENKKSLPLRAYFMHVHHAWSKYSTGAAKRTVSFKAEEVAHDRRRSSRWADIHLGRESFQNWKFWEP